MAPRLIPVPAAASAISGAIPLCAEPIPGGAAAARGDIPGPMPACPEARRPLPEGSRCCAVPREEEPAAGADRGGAGPGWARVAGGPRRTM